MRRQRHLYPSSLHSFGEFGGACSGHANSRCLENSGVPDNGQTQKIRRKTRKFSKNCPLVPLIGSLGSLSNDDGNAKDDGWKKMDLNFIFEFRNSLELFYNPSGLKPYSN